jgi:segregation and condensation protein A
MRDAGARLMARDRVGRDVFVRPDPEGLRTDKAFIWDASLFDLIQAYGQIKARTQPAVHVVSRRPVMALDDAIARVSRLIGSQIDWAVLEAFLPPGLDAALGRSALASSFVAALELARQGRLDIRQDGAFSPLYLRAAQSRGAPEMVAS